MFAAELLNQRGKLMSRCVSNRGASISRVKWRDEHDETIWLRANQMRNLGNGEKADPDANSGCKRLRTNSRYGEVRALNAHGLACVRDGCLNLLVALNHSDCRRWRAAAQNLIAPLPQLHRRPALGRVQHERVPHKNDRKNACKREEHERHR
jgi:hypothetical protein